IDHKYNTYRNPHPKTAGPRFPISFFRVSSVFHPCPPVFHSCSIRGPSLTVALSEPKIGFLKGEKCELCSRFLERRSGERGWPGSCLEGPRCGGGGGDAANRTTCSV